MFTYCWRWRKQCTLAENTVWIKSFYTVRITFDLQVNNTFWNDCFYAVCVCEQVFVQVCAGVFSDINMRMWFPSSLSVAFNVNHVSHMLYSGQLHLLVLLLIGEYWWWWWLYSTSQLPLCLTAKVFLHCNVWKSELMSNIKKEQFLNKGLFRYLVLTVCKFAEITALKQKHD